MSDGRQLLGKETLTADELHALLARLNDQDFGRSTFPTLDAVAEATGQTLDDLTLLLAQIRSERKFAAHDSRLHAIERSNRKLLQTIQTLEAELKATQKRLEDVATAHANMPPQVAVVVEKPPTEYEPDHEKVRPLANILVTSLHGRHKRRKPTAPSDEQKQAEKAPGIAHIVGLVVLTTMIIPGAAAAWNFASAYWGPVASRPVFYPNEKEQTVDVDYDYSVSR